MSWFRIQEMFRFDAFHMYGIIGTAVVTAAISLLMIKRLALADRGWNAARHGAEDGRPGRALRGRRRGIRSGLGADRFLSGSDCRARRRGAAGDARHAAERAGGHVDIRETTSQAATLNGRSRKEQSMIIQQFYLSCLAHASYLVGDEQSHVAAVVDPQRDVAQYLAFAQEHDLRITHVFLTHLHADFLAGHLELREPDRRRHLPRRAGDRRVRVPSDARRRCDRFRARADHRARDPRPHARVDLAAPLRSRPQRHASACGADRRHALRRRCRPARPACRARLVGRRRWAVCCTTRCTRSSWRCRTTASSTPPTAQARSAARRWAPRRSRPSGNSAASNYALQPMSRGRLPRYRHGRSARRAGVLHLRRGAELQGTSDARTSRSLRD